MSRTSPPPSTVFASGSTDRTLRSSDSLPLDAERRRRRGHERPLAELVLTSPNDREVIERKVAIPAASPESRAFPARPSSE